MSEWQDEGRRGRFAVALSLLTEPGQPTRLIFDDIEAESVGLDRRWKHHTFVTMVELGPSNLERGGLSKERLGDLGRMVIGGLAAHRVVAERLPNR